MSSAKFPIPSFRWSSWLIKLPLATFPTASRKFLVNGITYSINVSKDGDEIIFKFVASSRPALGAHLAVCCEGTEMSEYFQFNEYDYCLKFPYDATATDLKVEWSMTIECQTPVPELLQSPMGKLLLSNDAADCWFVVEKQEIPTYKLVLSSVSPVFKAMLSSDCAEAKTGKIPIVDFSLDSMKVIHSVIYEKLNDNELYVHLNDIYRFLDKYNMNELMKWVTEILMKKLTFQNICITASAACSYQDKSDDIQALYQKCLTMFVNNYQFISKMNHYDKLDSDVVKDVMEKIPIPEK